MFKNQDIIISTIAPLWKRIIAFSIDFMFLGIIGTLLGLVLFNQLSHLGPWGVFFGFLISMVYFGIFNSFIGNGQTPGKRLVKIQVVNHQNQLLSLSTSFLRFIPIGVPLVLTNSHFPAIFFYPMGIIVHGFLTLGLSLTIAYVLLINKTNRQTLHDLLVGSFVVNVDSASNKLLPTTLKRFHLWVSIILVVSAGIIPYLGIRMVAGETIRTLFDISTRVSNEPWVSHTHIQQGHISTGSGVNRNFATELNITVYLRDSDTQNEQRLEHIASVALSTPRGISPKVTRVQIKLKHGIDIGIVSISKSSHSDSRTLDQWQ